MKKIFKNTIEFVNHASVIISGEKTKVLSDPWYSLSAFHDGWNLIYENSEEDIVKVLEKITHIWISHEHPDHFSISFFKKYKELIRTKKIKILFQETKDKRVIKFLKHLNLEITELKNEKSYKLDENYFITCVKSGFYDSALIFNVDGLKIFNLNDCPIESHDDIKRFKKKFGICDVLLTQFSYAAWKGNKSSEEWAKNAAQNKINIIKNQANILNPKTVIPFASFIKFSNTKNSHLNKNSNSPDQIIKKIDKDKIKIVFLRPYEEQNLSKIEQDEDSLVFWRNEIIKSNKKQLNMYKKRVNLDELNFSFLKYKKRIFDRNSYLMIKLISLVPYISPFEKIVIYVEDIKKSIIFNFFSDKLITTELDYDISLSSESLDFIFNNSFGFDTLTVNGCFETGNKNGFEKATKLLAIENLNNLGIYFNISILLNLRIFFIFFERLKRVKINLAN
jgi:hypothetical protein